MDRMPDPGRREVHRLLGTRAELAVMLMRLDGIGALASWSPPMAYEPGDDRYVVVVHVAPPLTAEAADKPAQPAGAAPATPARPSVPAWAWMALCGALGGLLAALWFHLAWLSGRAAARWFGGHPSAGGVAVMIVLGALVLALAVHRDRADHRQQTQASARGRVGAR